MIRSLLATAGLWAALAMPGLAQTPAARSATPAAPPTAPAAAMARPAAPAVTAPAPATAGKRIDINAASESELASLPGIGPVTAKAIVAGRPWDDLAELTAKKVVNQPTFERNKDRFALANINTSSAPDMAKTLPGIGQATAPKIVAGRPYATPADLVSKKVLTQAQFDKIKDLVTY